MNSTVMDYLRLGGVERQALRTTAHALLTRSREQYVDLLAAEAVLVARMTHPTASRLVFDIGDDLGPTASLVAVYDVADGLLWHVDRDEEYPDESNVTDFLAAAMDSGDGLYHPFEQVGDDRYEYELTDE